MERRQEAEQERQRQEKDAEGYGSEARIYGDEGDSEQESQERLSLVGVDRQGVVSGVEHLGERDEVEEERGDGGGDGEVSPAGTVVECGGQDGERGDAVEEDRDSEPEEGHDRGFQPKVGRDT